MYQSYYKLTGKPFRLSPDPSFFFPSRGHKRALAYLRYGLNQDEGFVVITGSPGTGKTTLAKILLHEMGEKDVVVAHLTTTQLEADDMLRMVTASFGLRYENLDKTQLLKSLEGFLLARSRENKRALLVIDEAQNLPARSLEELRMLSNLQVGDKALVQTFLLGQAQFRALLDKPELEQLRQRIIANYHLSPLAADESQRYIESRLQQVGWSGDPKFAEIAYEKVHEYTEGIPRRINMLCDRVLLYSCMEEIHEITGEVIDLVTSELDNEISGSPVSIESSKGAAKTRSQTPVMTKNNTIEKSKSASKPKVAMPSGADKGKVDTQQPIVVEDAPTEAMDSVALNKYIKQKEQPAKSKNKPADEHAEEVQGNTVTRTNPKRSASATDDKSTSEIQERDLFRVIPGGKPHEEAADGVATNDSVETMAPAAQAKPTAADVIQRRILRLVLAFHRSPSRFPGLDNPTQPLPEGITELLELAIADDDMLTQVSPAAVMGISPAMLRAAVRFFVRRALFVVDGDDYRVLGLQPGAKQQDVEKHYDLLMRLLRQDKQRGSADSVARVGQAYENLSRLDQAQSMPFQARDASDDTLNVKASDDTVNIKRAALPTARKVRGSVKSLDNLPVDKTLAVKLNKTGKLNIEQGPDFEIEEGEISIDFDSVTGQNNNAQQDNVFLRKPNEVYSGESKFSRKSMRYAGQFAVLGFGAVVIILGLYIVQIQPSDSEGGDDVVVKKLNLNEPGGNAAESRKRGLQLSDGTVAAITESRNKLTANRNKPAGQANEDLAVLEKEERVSTASSLNRQRDISTGNTQQSAALNSVSSTQSSNLANRTESEQLATYAELDSEAESTNSAGTAAVAGAGAGVISQSANSSSNAAEISPRDITASDLNIVEDRVLNAPVAENEQFSNASTSQAEFADLDSPSENVAEIERAAESVSPAQMVAAPAAAAIVLSNSPSGAAASNRQAMIQQPESQEQSSTAINPSNEVFDAQQNTDPTVVAATSTLNTPVPPANLISDVELDNMIHAFVGAYETGNIDQIMQNFSRTARTNTRKTVAGIRTDYLDLFNSTSYRQMKFDSIRWDKEGDHARGVGEYVARINPNGSNQSQSFFGNVTIQAQQYPDGIKMTRLYLANQSVSSGPPLGSAAKEAEVVAKAAIVSVAPTISELNGVVSDFVQAYDKGDIDNLMKLFAENARTNDQTSLAGIRKDHSDLFKSTSVRQMTIDKMNWSFDRDKANSSANFVVLIQGINNPSIDTYRGTIQFSAKKDTDGAVRITQMLHTLK